MIFKKRIVALIFFAMNPSIFCQTDLSKQPTPEGTPYFLYDDVINVSAQDVLMRFYHIQRLQKSVDVLIELQNRHILNFDFQYHYEPNGLHIENQYFIDPIITSALHQACSKKNVLPLRMVWHDLIAYKHMHRIRIIPEFTGAVLCVLHKVLLTHGIDKSPIESFFVRVSKDVSLDSIPLEELLDVLDLLLEEVPRLVEKYELNQPINWQKWAKKHWLLAPIACTALAIKVYLIFKKSSDAKKNNGTL